MRTAAFDDLAASYDATFTQTALGSALRELVWSRLDVALGNARRVLDLGCGTGEDAVRLARAGAEVVAIDPSINMLQIARRKAESSGCAARIQFLCASMEDLAAVLKGGGRFDGVLSNFGAINCIPDLPRLTRELAASIEPGAPLLWVLLGPRVPWEWLWFLARGEPTKAWRRLRPEGVRWRGLTIRYPAPADLAGFLSPYFTITRISPLGFSLPPTYAATWLERARRVLRVLLLLERAAQRHSGLASWSDHYIVEAVRSEVRA